MAIYRGERFEIGIDLNCCCIGVKCFDYTIEAGKEVPVWVMFFLIFYIMLFPEEA